MGGWQRSGRVWQSRNIIVATFGKCDLPVRVPGQVRESLSHRRRVACPRGAEEVIADEEIDVSGVEWEGWGGTATRARPFHEGEGWDGAGI